MSKAKSKGTIMVADSSGGMVQVKDRRFEERANWPIRFKVLSEQADAWMQYFYAECARREWSCSGMGQIEASGE
ncbi:MAG TPA: hypothetical protein VKA02_00305 [Candidatus Acidoferrum sp.]|nr:hypothetical protein [Candidatus Acidoferrum sp.]